MGVQRVLQVDLKMESFPEPLGSRWMAWQVEYPAGRVATQEAETEIRLAQEDLAGIVPLAMVSDATSITLNVKQCILTALDTAFLSFHTWNQHLHISFNTSP